MNPTLVGSDDTSVRSEMAEWSMNRSALPKSAVRTTRPFNDCIRSFVTSVTYPEAPSAFHPLNVRSPATASGNV